MVPDQKPILYLAPTRLVGELKTKWRESPYYQLDIDASVQFHDINSLAANLLTVAANPIDESDFTQFYDEIKSDFITKLMPVMRELKAAKKTFELAQGYCAVLHREFRLIAEFLLMYPVDGRAKYQASPRSYFPNPTLKTHLQLHPIPGH